MIFIGLDIGSTTLSAVALDADTRTEHSRMTRAHHAALPSEHPWEHLQDPLRISLMCREIIAELCRQHQDAAGIGLCGQMHGILYLDEAGQAVSPLYTWQDRRCEIPDEDGHVLIDELSRYAQVRSGYGLATHIWNLRHGKVPPQARWLTTIGSYIAMQLTHASSPVLHPSDAAALGFFDLAQCRFDTDQLHLLGVDSSLLPPLVSDQPLAGLTDEGIPVFWALGDNQASFLGSVEDMEHAALLNIGTGSQISLMLPQYTPVSEGEIRPLTDHACIAVGSALCGGRSYALLESFFRQCAGLAGVNPDSLYEQMNRFLEESIDTDLRFDTLFCGTRSNPLQRASITQLSPDNFTPAHFVRAILNGIVQELHGYFLDIQRQTNRPVNHIICSGNLVRLLPKLIAIAEKTFGLPCSMAALAEEAACGAALYARNCTASPS